MMTRGVLRLVLLGYLLMLLYGGWMPFHFHYQPAQFRAEVHQAVHFWPLGPASGLRRMDVITNLLIFAPAGFFLAGWKEKWRMRQLLPAALVVSGAVSFAIEFGQLFIDNRTCSCSDWTFNTFGGVVGSLVGLVTLGPVARAFWKHIGPHLKGKPGYLGAAAIAMAMLVATAWPFRYQPSLLHAHLRGIDHHLLAGLSSMSWFEWIWRQIACYILFTMLLICPGGSRRASLWRIVFAMTAGISLAVVAQAVHLVLVGPAPNLTKIAVGAASCLFAGLLGPHLISDRLQLRTIVLGIAVVLLGLAVYAEYLAIHGGLGRDTHVPLWGLYWHESLYEAYRTLWRWASTVSLAFAAAYYLSLRTRLPLRYRLVLATLLSGFCVTGAEMVKRLIWPGAMDVAGMGEQLLASATGAILFAILWRLLDRRGAGRSAVYAGADRRQSTYTGPERRQGRR